MMDKWFGNNTMLKLVALVIGTMLWMVVNFNEAPVAPPTSPDRTITVQEEIIPVVEKDRFAAIEINPERVTVVITGKLNRLSQLNVRNLEAYVNLNDYMPGDHAYVPVEIRGLPSNVSAEIIPKFVRVTLEDYVQKEMDVTIDITGSAAAGFTVGEPVVTPSNVRLTGSETDISAIVKVAGNMTVDGAQSDVEGKLKLIAYDADGNKVPIDMEPQVVNVRIPISSPYKSVPLILNITGQPPSGYAIASVRQDVNNVVIFATQEVLDAIDFYMGPMVDVSTLTESTEYKLDIPIHGGVSQTDPTRVRVFVSIAPSESKEFEALPIRLNGLGSGLEARWTDTSDGLINAVVEGARDILAKVKPEDVQPIVDLSERLPGTHRVQVQWNLPLYVKPPEEEIYVTLEIIEQTQE